MAFVSYTVHLDGLDEIEKRLINTCSKAEHALAIQVRKDTEPFVPAQTLSLNSRTVVRGNTIIYPGPYARFLYYGKLMVDPETGSAWAKKNATKILTNRDLVFTQTVHRQAQSHWFEASKAVNKEKWLKMADKEVKKNG